MAPGKNPPKSLRDLGRGESATVLSFEAESDCCRRLQEMGLTKGTEVSVVKVAPLGDPFEIAFRGQRICLRKCEAECILIGKKQPEPAD